MFLATILLLLMIQYEFFSGTNFHMDLRCLRCLSFCTDGCLMPGSGECYVKSTGPNRINISHEWNISATTVLRDKLLEADANLHRTGETFEIFTNNTHKVDNCVFTKLTIT